MGIENKIITITAGTPQQLSTTDIFVSRISMQMGAGAAGAFGEWITVPVGVTPAAHGGTAGQLSRQLPAATSATVPGVGWEERMDYQDGLGINLREIWVDGQHTGDTVLISFNRRN